MVVKAKTPAEQPCRSDMVCLIPDDMGAENILEDRFYPRFCGDGESVFVSRSVCRDKLCKGSDLRRCDIIPQEGEIRVQKGSGSTTGKSLLFGLRMSLPSFQVPPGFAVCTGGKDMVVLHELPVTDENLSDIKDGGDLGTQFPCLFCIVDPEYITVDQFHGRPLDRINR